MRHFHPLKRPWPKPKLRLPASPLTTTCQTFTQTHHKSSVSLGQRTLLTHAWTHGPQDVSHVSTSPSPPPPPSPSPSPPSPTSPHPSLHTYIPHTQIPSYPISQRKSRSSSDPPSLLPSLLLIKLSTQPPLLPSTIPAHFAHIVREHGDRNA